MNSQRQDIQVNTGVRTHAWLAYLERSDGNTIRRYRILTPEDITSTVCGPEAKQSQTDSYLDLAQGVAA
jgi:hypothetical protein